MVSPIDYTLDVVNPFQAALQGYNQGTIIASNQDALEAKRLEEARKQQQFLAQQLQQKDMYEFSLIPNKTYDDFVNFTTRYPQLTEQYKKSWEIMDGGQRQQALSTAAQVMSAIRAGSPEVVQEIYEEQAKAYENSGQKESAFNMRRMAGLAKKDPANMYTTLGLFGMAVSPDEFAPMMDKMGTNIRADEMQPYEIAESQAKTGLVKAQTQGQTIENTYKPQQLQGSINQTQSQIAVNYATIENMAERLGLDKDKLATETELKLQELNPSNIKLSDGSQKLVNDYMVASVASEQTANQQLDLANRIQAAGGGVGRLSSWNEKLKELTGNQDSLTNLRNEYTRIRNSQAIKMLPPGPATDRDIEMALKGFPPETADSKAIASFLRGMAKMNQRDAAYQQMQAEWINQVGGMGSTKRDVEVLGVKIPTGTTFQKFATANMNKALKTQSNQAVQRQVATGQRSYMSVVQ